MTYFQIHETEMWKMRFALGLQSLHILVVFGTRCCYEFHSIVYRLFLSMMFNLLLFDKRIKNNMVNVIVIVVTVLF